ncbi:MAG: tetratricopeptide repeat protein [Brevinema sp.]
MKFLWLIIGIFFLPYHSFTQNIGSETSLYNNDFDSDKKYTADALNRLYIIGLQYLNEGELTQAEISFRSILAFPYRSDDWRTVRYYKGKAHFYLGDIYFIMKKYNKSSEHYQQVVQEYRTIEEYSSSLFKLGRSLILGKKEKEGIQVLKDYNYNYAVNEGFVDNTLYWIANAYISLEDYSSALKTLHQILRDFPDSPMAYDIRILIAKLETDLKSEIPNSENQDLQNTLNQTKEKVEKIEKEKELIIRMKQLLSLKEQLLIMKEKKLELLEKVSKSRAEALDNNVLLTDPDTLLIQ